MTTALPAQASLSANAPSSASAPRAKAGKVLLQVDRYQWIWTVLFMLSCSITGLELPFGYLFLLLILINRWKNNRYDFIVQTMILTGGFGLTNKSLLLDLGVLGFLAAMVLLMLYRKPRIVKQTLCIIGAYFVFLLIIASFSDERMRVQLLLMRHYLTFIYFLVPVAAFHDREFDIMKFWQRMLPYMIVMSCFYIFDGFVIRGCYLLPATSVWGAVVDFAHPLTGFPLGIVRVMPHGMTLIAICLFPLARYYKLKPWMWVVIIFGLLATKTFTVMTGCIIFYIVLSGHAMKLVKYGILAIVVAVGAYFLDRAITPKLTFQTQNSTLRIYSSVQQFIRIYENFDDEEAVADFASGRMAQIIPKFELISRYHKEAVGLGFLHPSLTTNRKYEIYNRYYQNNAKSYEKATTIEVAPAQIYLNTGYIGLIGNFLYLLALWLLVRKLPYSGYFGSVMLFLSFTGISGISALIQITGNSMLGTAFAAVLLANAKNLKGFRKDLKQ